MAKLKDDPAVQALLTKAQERAAAAELKARKAYTKQILGLVKQITQASSELVEDRVTKRALKELAVDITDAVKGA